MRIRVLLAACAALAAPAAAFADVDVAADPEFPCTGNCAHYNVAQAPFHLYGGSYYVGTTLLSAILIDTGDGLILIDGGFPGGAPTVADNIRKLGFDVEDIKLIANSHTHIDHVGVIDAFQKATGAPVLASPASADAMAAGHAMKDDPQYRDRPGHDFPPVSNIRRISDGQATTLGDTGLVAHFTPGHTPGGTTWTWKECEDGACLDMVYADSLNAISAPDYAFKDHPDMLAAFRDSINTVAALPCDILVVPHPDLIGLLDKVPARGETPASNPYIDAGACAAYAEAAHTRLEDKLKAEAEQ